MLFNCFQKPLWAFIGLGFALIKPLFNLLLLKNCRIRNGVIKWFSVLDWFNNWFEIVALLLVSSEFVYIILETFFTLFSTEIIISDCWIRASAILFVNALIDGIRSLITCITEIVRFVDSILVFKSWMYWLISKLLSLLRKILMQDFWPHLTQPRNLFLHCWCGRL